MQVTKSHLAFYPPPGSRPPTGWRTKHQHPCAFRADEFGGIVMTMMKNLKQSMAQYGEMLAVIGHNL